MGRIFTERFVWPQDQAAVRSAAERAFYEKGWEIKPGGTDWELRAAQAMTTLSWGERIRITMGTFPGGGTQAIVESKLVFGFVDWGRNRTNVEAIRESMETVLGPARVEPI